MVTHHLGVEGGTVSRIGEPPLWFMFGEYPDGIHVDVNDGDEDVLVKVTREAAVAAIAKQQAVWDAWLARDRSNDG